MKFVESYKQIDLFGKTALIISSGFGTGLIPKAPGTFASLATVPLVIGLSYLSPALQILSLAIFIAVAIGLSDISEKSLKRQDPPEIVIDEAAGILITCFLLPVTWVMLISGFLLFRFFDILKPYPIKKTEKISGGMGIVLDDLLAGVYAHLCLRLFLYFMMM